MTVFPIETGGGHWQRIWQSEQDVNAAQGYKPQIIQDVIISRSPSKREGDHLILTLGHESWCASNWHSVYYRLWHLEPSHTEPLLLLNEDKFAFLFGNSPQASVTPVYNPSDESKVIYDVLVELTASSIDGAKLTYEMVGHYRVEGDGVKRIDPVALSPGDFVDEWISEPWKEVAAWTERKSIQFWNTGTSMASVLEAASLIGRPCTAPELQTCGRFLSVFTITSSLSQPLTSWFAGGRPIISRWLTLVTNRGLDALRKIPRLTSRGRCSRSGVAVKGSSRSVESFLGPAT